MNRSAAQYKGDSGNVNLDSCSQANVLLFDLDGTLVDTAPDIFRSLNHALHEINCVPVSLERVRMWIGNGIRSLLEQAITSGSNDKVDCDVLDEGIQLFEMFYLKNLWNDSECYPGVLSGLNHLKGAGFKMGCVTNKPRLCARMLLAQSALDQFFEIVVAGGDLEVLKPSPKPLTYAARMLGVECHECVMVGDSKNDVKAAKAAGMAMLLVTWGYHQDSEFSSMAVTKQISEFKDILSAVNCKV